MVLSYRRAGDQVVPVKTLLWRSLGWIIPLKALRGTRIPYTVSSLLFHIGMLVTPIFLSGHVELIRRGIGLSWPTLKPAVADGLTLVTLAAVILLFLLRLVSTASRFLTGFQDWFLLVLCLIPFVTGFLVAHPASNPFPFLLTYLIHLLSAELLLMLVPFTKLVHIVLFPFTQISWELGWHFAPGSGERVRLALGKEGEPV
jgi:nitrate reductase gamma subunit